MKLLAGLEVTTKSVERTAEAIGADIAQGEQAEIRRAVQLDLPIVLGKPIPILYVQMDGTGIPVVKKETVGRQGKTDGQPSHTREVKLGCVFTQTAWDKGFPIRDPIARHRNCRGVWQASLRGSMEARLEPRGEEGRHGRRRRMSGTDPQRGSGICRNYIFLVRCKLWIFITRASTSGIWPAGYTRMTKPKTAG